ncbi:MAG TPA: hypothetical protein VMG31_00260 [Verrucomicrobiae bacterium]|nr:hypothetical protein [Verrucomicrobiae bacterium]
MRKVVILSLLALELAVCGCGSNPTPTNVISTTANGTWEAQLTGGVGQASLMNFTTSFVVTDIGPIDPTGLSFLNQQTCFVTNNTETGTASFTTSSSGQVTGTMQFIVTSGIPAGNVLTLKGNLTGTSNGTTSTTGTLTNGVVTGTWTLTGSSDCTGTGNFTMCQGKATCSAT